jgi:hypothetical protein
MQVPDARANARERVERQATEARGFGGRRIGFVTDNPEERARRVELEQRLYDLARRAVRGTREVDVPSAESDVDQGSEELD